VVAAVLHLGNVEFEEVDQNGSLITAAGTYHAEQASGLMGFPAPHTSLQWALCNRSLEVRNETMVVALSPSQATAARDALAKALFSRLFDWIVRRLNRCMPMFSEVCLIPVLYSSIIELVG
jgi:myosin heavy subunit